MPDRVPYVRLRPSATRDYETAESRRDAKRFYASARWRAMRALVLAEQPLCPDCASEGRVESATEVHHKQERRKRPDLAFVRANLEGLCKAHHNAKRKSTPP